MTYSAKALNEIPRDCARLRAYFWRMAQHHRQLAAEHRRDTRANRVDFEEGCDLIRQAGVLERVASVVLANFDELVESTYEGDK